MLYFEGHIVVDPKDTPLTKGEVLSDEQLGQAREDFGSRFEAGIGAEAIQSMLKDLNVEELSQSLRVEMAGTKSEAKRKKLTKRMKVINSFRTQKIKPEMTILNVVPCCRRI